MRPIAAPVFINPGIWWSWQEFEEWFQEESFGYLGRHTKRVPKVMEIESSIEVLKAIIQLANADPRSNNNDLEDVQWGLSAIETYANDIADLSKGERYFDSGWLGCHNIYLQWTAREITADYLEKSAELFPEEISSLLSDAAREYLAAHAAWLEWERHLGNVEKAPKNGWHKKKHRLAGAEAVREALEHEKKAVNKIKQAAATLTTN